MKKNLPDRTKPWPILLMIFALGLSFLISAMLATDLASPVNHIMEVIMGAASAIYILRVIFARWRGENGYGFIPYALGMVALPFFSAYVARPFDNPEMFRLYREQNRHRWEKSAEQIDDGNSVNPPGDERTP